MFIPHMASPIILPWESIPTPGFCIFAGGNRAIVLLRGFVYVVVMTPTVFGCLKAAAAYKTALWMCV